MLFICFHIQVHNHILLFRRSYSMKKHHLLATLLALVLMVSALPMTASAYTITTVQVPSIVRINVDGSFVSDTNAYLDSNGDVRVPTGEDLLKIFPKELKDTVIAYDPSTGVVVKDYINALGYSYRLLDDYYTSLQRGYTLYIYTGKNDNWMNYFPGTNFEYPEVYINGVYTPLSSPYFYWNLDLSKYQAPVFSGNRVYLNNDGNTPVEVFVDGKLIHFPDQQPIVMNPGRTMVPIRMIAEMLGCKVDWDNAQRCAVIAQGKNTMYIYPGSTSYVFNGKYYDMDVTPVLLNNRTMVPLRFIAERFGYKVDFQSGDVLTVTLNKQ